MTVYKPILQDVHLGVYLKHKKVLPGVARDAGDGDPDLPLDQKIIFCRFVSFWPGCHIAARANKNAGLALL